MKNIELENLKTWHKKKRVLYTASSIGNKKLYCTLSGNFEICVGDKVVHCCSTLLEAVKRYNKII